MAGETNDVVLPGGLTVKGVPAGMTQSQLLDRLSQSGMDVSEIQRSITKPIFGEAGFARAAKDEAATRSMGERFMQGVGETFDRYAYGAKKLFTDLSPQEKLRLSQNRSMADAGGGAAMAGQLAGDVAIGAPLAAAGGAVLGPAAAVATSPLPRTMQQLAGAAATGAAQGALSSPEDRTGGAVGGAAGGTVGYAGGRVLQRALGGAIPATGDAADMMRQGIRVPIWQAADPETLTGRTVRRVGELARRLPMAGAALRSQEGRAKQDWNRLYGREATPPRPVLDDAGGTVRWEPDQLPRAQQTGDDTMNALRDRFGTAYDVIQGHRVPLDQAYHGEVSQLISATERYAPNLEPEVRGTVNRITDTLARGTEGRTVTSPVLDANGRPFTDDVAGHATVSAEALKDALAETSDAINNAYRAGRGDLADIYQGLRQTLEDLRSRSTPPEHIGAREDVNRAYTRFKQLQEAHGMMGAQRSGMVTPRQVLSSMKSLDRSPSKSAFERKNIPGQRDVLRAERVLGNELPDVGPGTADALALMGYASPLVGGLDMGATLLLGTAPGQRFLAGTYPGQAALRASGALPRATAAAAAGAGARRYNAGEQNAP